MTCNAVLSQGCIDINWCRNCGSLDCVASPGLENGRIEVSKNTWHAGKPGRWVSYHTQFENGIKQFVPSRCNLGLGVTFKENSRGEVTIYSVKIKPPLNLDKPQHSCSQAISLSENDKTKSVFRRYSFS